MDSANPFDDQPRIASGGDGQSHVGLESVIQCILPWLAVLLTNQSVLDKTRVVKWQRERSRNFDIDGIVNHRQPLHLQLRIDVQDRVDIAAIRPADMDNVGFENATVGFVEIYPLLHDSFGLVRVVKLITTVCALHAGTEKRAKICAYTSTCSCNGSIVAAAPPP